MGEAEIYIDMKNAGTDAWYYDHMIQNWIELHCRSDYELKYRKFDDQGRPTYSHYKVKLLEREKII